MRLRWTIVPTVATLCVSLAAPLAVSAQAFDANRLRAQTPSSRSEQNADAEFVKRAAESGQREIEAGKLALERSAHGEVRAFAERMVQDHTVVHGELMSLAVSPPAEPRAEDKAPMAALTTAQAGAPFDRAYMSQMVTDHEATVLLFEREAADGKDQRLKLWAEQKLPKLREHLELARALHAKLASTSR